MTQDIIEMAIQADLIDDTYARDWYIYQLQFFAKLVAAKERERIAKQWDGRMYGDCEDIDIGAAIRNRGEA